MTRYSVEATYENGVLKLDKPLPLKDNERVHVAVFAGPSRVRQTAGLMPWKGSVEDLDYLINDPDIYP
jgi:predicted DNA-binding antitoxin AbrB/MazE fold protein